MPITAGRQPARVQQAVGSEHEAVRKLLQPQAASLQHMNVQCMCTHARAHLCRVRPCPRASGCPQAHGTGLCRTARRARATRAACAPHPVGSTPQWQLCLRVGCGKGWRLSGAFATQAAAQRRTWKQRARCVERQPHQTKQRHAHASGAPAIAPAVKRSRLPSEPLMDTSAWWNESKQKKFTACRARP